MQSSDDSGLWEWKLTTLIKCFKKALPNENVHVFDNLPSILAEDFVKEFWEKRISGSWFAPYAKSFVGSICDYLNQRIQENYNANHPYHIFCLELLEWLCRPAECNEDVDLMFRRRYLYLDFFSALVLVQSRPTDQSTIQLLAHMMHELKETIIPLVKHNIDARLAQKTSEREEALKKKVDSPIVEITPRRAVSTYLISPRKAPAKVVSKRSPSSAIIAARPVETTETRIPQALLLFGASVPAPQPLPITYDSVATLPAYLQQMPNETIIDLHGKNLTGIDATKLCQILPAHIETLNISHNENLFTELRNKESKSLVSHAGAVAIAELLKTHQSLKILNLSNCVLDSISASCIANGLAKNSSLECLILSQNCIGDLGAINICTALLPHPQFKHLILIENGLTDECAALILKLLNKSYPLTLIEINGNRFSPGIITRITEKAEENDEQDTLKRTIP
ncbi:MAG: hypothetical protein M3R00_01760 [Pseudomonadota bacterium]|nr:hypothetical protein [Pseudomonadota bacterium]